jgi:hypothetical protein
MTKKETRILTKEERVAFLDAIAKEIFQKGLKELDVGQIATMKANLIVRLRGTYKELKNQKITDSEYEQLKEELNKL